VAYNMYPKKTNSALVNWSESSTFLWTYKYPLTTFCRYSCRALDYSKLKQNI